MTSPDKLVAEKVFYVATNSLATNKDQGRKYVVTFSKYVAT